MSLPIAWKILRDLGPSWVFKRLGFAARIRSGTLKRLLPLSDWQFDSSRPPCSNQEGISGGHALKNKFFFSYGELVASSPSTHSCDQADRVLSGEWQFFSSQWLRIGFPPDWHLNVLDGRRVPNTYHWSEIDLDAIHDVKFVWEPSRFAVAYLLVRAYAASKDERYPAAFWQLVEDWVVKNPPNRGVNWASGQEAALRVMAWCFGLHAFLGSSSSTPERVSRLFRMIEVHGDRIAAFIGYGLSQRNNHGIGEAVGLFTIEISFPQLHRAEEWKALGQKLIEAQIREQVYEDGSYIQHSFNYQRVLIDYLVWSFRLGELNDSVFSKASYEILGRAVHFMLRFCDPKTGLMPNYGSNDGSLVLPLSSCDFLDYRPSLQAAHYLVHREFCFGKGEWDEQSHWLFGTEPFPQVSTGLQCLHGSKGNQVNSGYMKLVGQESYAMLRAGRYVDRPSQADQLHLDLWWRGQNIVCDPGTYLYNAPRPWTNALSGTGVHNTASIGDRDQMTRAGRFLWVDWAQSETLSYDLGDSQQAVQVRHDGYERLGATHRRSVCCISDEDCWVVVDDICGSFRGRVRLHWLFPNFPHEWRPNEFRVALQTSGGTFQCCVHTAHAKTATLVIGGRLVSPNGAGKCESDLQIRGWRSLYYGQKDAALSLAVDTNGRVPFRFVTVLAPSTVRLLKIDDTVVEVSSDRKIHRVSLRPAGSERIFSEERRFSGNAVVTS